ncbi:MAG: TlpA family protein disulfide reductase [Thermoleophilia bacterium]|nr:TlpA family protein disulfide reductase [Thermoleophilia bacterium]
MGLLIIVLLVVGLMNRGGATTIDDALDMGNRPPAPEITLPVLVSGPGLPPAGQQASLSDLRGKVVLLNLWASWCGPCKEEAPVLEAVSDRYREKGVIVLGIDIQDLTEDALAFIEEYRLTYPSLRDGSDVSKTSLEATGVPETYLIDRTGRIALHIAGPVSNTAQLSVPIDQVLAEAP